MKYFVIKISNFSKQGANIVMMINSRYKNKIIIHFAYYFISSKYPKDKQTLIVKFKWT